MTVAQQTRRSRSLSEFSPEAREAIETQAITGAWELRKLQRVLGELTRFDEANEAATKQAQNRMLLSMAAVGICVVAMIVVTDWEAPGLGLLLPLPALGLAVHLWRRWKQLKQADLINDFRLCLMPGLRDMAQDLDPAKKIRVRMDLAGPVERKQKSKQELPPGRFQKLTETVFEDPWCEVRLPLVDGSTAVLEFEVVWVKHERRYSSRRGKTKFKTKWRKKCAATATLLPGGPRQWDEAALQARLDATRERAQLVEKDGVKAARLERYWVFKGAADPPPDAPPAREVVGMLLRLYSAMGGSEVAR